MAKSKLSSAYKAAASSGGSYQASLYDVANIGYQRESSAQLAGIKAQDRSRTVGMISEGLDLAGNVIRKGQRKKETETAAGALGAKAKERSLWGKLTGEEQMYEKAGEGGEMGTVSGSDIMAEYKLQQQEKAFGRSTTVDETTGKATSTPAPGSAPKGPPTLAEETGIVDKKDTYNEPIGPTQGGSPLGQAESPIYQGPTQSGKTLDVPQTSQGEIDKFNKSKAGTKLQKELGQLFGDDFSNYGFGG
jgi:hypothetical protein